MRGTLIGYESAMFEHLLGFSAREHWQTFEDSWPVDRQALYLLRTDLDKPLSTDTFVWASLFPTFDFQPTLEELQHALAQSDPEKPYCIIAITQVTVLEESTLSLDSGWQRLGYDVADDSRLSGLSNCGYLRDEIDDLREEWGPYLNLYHLFEDAERAWDFRSLTNWRVPEHAPFYVYGLYLVEQHG